MTQTGVYVGTDPKDFASYSKWIGNTPGNVLNYLNNDSWKGFDSSVPWQVALWKGTAPGHIWSVPLTVWGTSLEQVATGAYNDHFLKAAQGLAQTKASSDGNMYVRVGWEFNGDWMPWAAKGHEGAFIKAFQELVTTFRSVSDKFKFVWDTTNDGGKMNPETAYPGDKYVDIIGTDVYYSTQWDGNNATKAFQLEVTRPYGLQWQQDFAAAHGKETAISEWGVASDNAGPYVQAMTKWMADHNMVYENYWDSNADYSGKLSTGANASAGAVYKDAIAGLTASADMTPPIVSSLVGAVSGPSNATSLTHTVTFSEAVTGVDASDFVVTSLNGNASARVASIIGSGTTYTVTLDQAQGDGTIRLDLKSSGTSIKDAAGNLIASGYTSAGAVTLATSTDAIKAAPPVSGAIATWAIGTSVNETMTGDARNNYLNGSGGQDTASGGKGDDTYVVDQQDDRVVEQAGEGIDTVESWTGAYTLSAHVENLILRGTHQTGTGNELANRITGGDGADLINGKAGNDWLTGGAGADTFIFERGTGKDTITDFAAGSAGHDVVRLSGSNYTSFDHVKANMTQLGADTLLSMPDGSSVMFLNHKVSDFNAGDFLFDSSIVPIYTISGSPSVNEGSNLVFTLNRTSDNGAQTVNYSLSGTATSGADYTTSSGNVSFAAGELSKQITLATSTDALVEGSESVVVTLTGVTGTGSVLSSSSKTATGTLVDFTPTLVPPPVSGATDTLVPVIPTLVPPPVSGAIATWAIGTSVNETMTGDARNNYLNGSGGQDTASGGKGDDTYVVDQQDDRVVEQAGEGIDTVESWTGAYTLSAHVENLILRGTHQTGTGNELANRITGGDGADLINGKAGNDWLTGGAGADTFIFERGTGKDTITDFAAGSAGHDVVRLSGSNYTSFDHVKANMTQLGADTLLSMPDGSSVMFLNHKVSDFNAGDFLFDSSIVPIYTISGSPSVNEGSNLVFTLNRTSDNGAQTVNYSLSGTATSGADYTTSSGNVSFAAGELSKQITLATSTDALVEGSESVVVTLTGVTGTGSVLSSSSKTATGTLVDFTPTLVPPPVSGATDTLVPVIPTLVPPPVSGAIATWAIGTSVNETMTGDARNNYLNGSGGQDTASGGKGDDTYVVDQQDDRVVEQAGEGIDTVESWTGAYTLSAHVENLILRGTHQTGTGNELANRITGGDGADLINGKAGNDWLTGGAGADTFIFERGTGKDTITDFAAGSAGHDVVRLSGSNYTSFDHVKANMTQLGADTLLSMPDGSSVMFLNHKVSDFNAGDFVM